MRFLAVSNFGLPRWVIYVFGAGLLGFGLAVSQGWIRDPSVARVFCQREATRA